MRRLLISGVATLIFGASAFGTAQAPDNIIVDGVRHPLFTNPLEKLYETQKRPEFAVLSEGFPTNNWRGYVASWAIDDSRLYLTAIDTYIEKEKITLRQLFPERERGGRVLADWFSGELRIPDGKQLQSVRMGYGSTFERDIIFRVLKGRVISRTVIDNRKKPLANEWERGNEELRKLQEWEKKTKQQP